MSVSETLRTLLHQAALPARRARHLRAGDGLLPVPVIVGVIAWSGLYLRDPKLRALVPTVDE